MWREVQFGDIANISPSNVDKKSVSGEAEVRLCNYMDVYDNRFVTNNLDYMVATATAAEIAKFSLLPSDVIFTKDSETPEDIAVASVVVEELENVICGYHLAIARPKAEIDGTFMMYRLWEDEVHKQFFRVANGSTRYGLTIGAISDVKFTIPDFPHQRKIANILKKSDEAIEKTEVLIAKYEQIKQGMMQDLFRRGVDENGLLRPPYSEAPHLYKKTELGWMPKEWDVEQLGSNIIAIEQGWSPDCDEVSADKSDWGILKTTAIVWDGYNDLANKKLPTSLDPKPRYEVKAQDILMTRAGPSERVGVVARVLSTQGRLMLSDKLYRIIPNDDFYKPFLGWALTSDQVQRQIDLLKSGMAESQTNISQEGIKKVFVGRPTSKDEQKKIAERLDSSRNFISQQKAFLAKLSQQKAGLMQDLLTGKVPVKVTNKERAE